MPQTELLSSLVTAPNIFYVSAGHPNRLANGIPRKALAFPTVSMQIYLHNYINEAIWICTEKHFPWLPILPPSPSPPAHKYVNRYEKKLENVWSGSLMKVYLFPKPKGKLLYYLFIPTFFFFPPKMYLKLLKVRIKVMKAIFYHNCFWGYNKSCVHNRRVFSLPPNNRHQMGDI